MAKQLIIRKSGIPHSPYHLVDENENFIATIHLSERCSDYAVLFSKAEILAELLIDDVNQSLINESE